MPQAAGLPPAAGPGSTGSFGGPSAPPGSVAHAWGPSPVVVPVDVKAVGEGDKVVTLSGEDAAAQARVTAACAEVTAAHTSSDLLMALRVRELRASCVSVFGTLMVCVSA